MAEESDTNPLVKSNLSQTRARFATGEIARPRFYNGGCPVRMCWAAEEE